MINLYVTGSFFSMTDIGLVRQTNEDNVLTAISPYGDILLAVADGMGGKNKGDYASKTLLRIIETAFSNLDEKLKKQHQIEKWLYKVVNEANKEIFNTWKKDELMLKGMGSTLSLAYISGNLLVTAQVGDSRIYTIENGKLKQLTVDQSYVMYLEHRNKISEEETKTRPDRHVLTNSVGIRGNVCLDIKVYPYNGQTVMLCSDGVYNNVSESDIASILKSGDTPERKCKQFISFGLSNGGTDNMAVIVWEARC